MPIKIIFNKHPLAVLQGAAREEGKIISKYEEVFDVTVKYFEGRARFRADRETEKQFNDQFIRQRGVHGL